MRSTVARYRDVRQSLHTPTWRRSRLGLDWTNLFIADVQTGFMMLALAPSQISVWMAMLLHAITAGIITPAIGAISLGLVGRRAMSVRTGRNYRYAAAGNAATAALMGLADAYFAQGAIFIAAAALCIPALLALAFIKACLVAMIMAGSVVRPAQFCP